MAQADPGSCPDIELLAQDTFLHTSIDLYSPTIRLAEVLLSVTDDLDRMIECRIRHDTNSAVYTCLSYVWGPASEHTRTILLNDRLFNVRRNLWDFLGTASRTQARERNIGIEKSEGPGCFDFEEVTKSLSINALCIDQDYTREKKHQVQQMGAIHENAQRVIAWFGKHKKLRNRFRCSKKYFFPFEQQGSMHYPSIAAAKAPRVLE